MCTGLVGEGRWEGEGDGGDGWEMGRRWERRWRRWRGDGKEMGEEMEEMGGRWEGDGRGDGGDGGRRRRGREEMEGGDGSERRWEGEGGDGSERRWREKEEMGKGEDGGRGRCLKIKANTM